MVTIRKGKYFVNIMKCQRQKKSIFSEIGEGSSEYYDEKENMIENLWLEIITNQNNEAKLQILISEISNSYKELPF